MPNYNELVKAIKKAGIDAVAAGGPVTVCFGKVVSVAPLQVLVEQKLMLGKAQLLLARNVTDYEVWISQDGVMEEPKKVTIYNGLCSGDEVLLLRQQGGQKYMIVDKVG